jgi:hypothetical protein
LRHKFSNWPWPTDPAELRALSEACSLSGVITWAIASTSGQLSALPVTYGTFPIDELPYAHEMDNNGVVQIARGHGDIIMKLIISALLTLTVLAGIAAPASADYNPKEDAGLRSPL